MSTAIMQSLTFIIFIVSEKIATLKFLSPADTRPANLTLIITHSHSACESKILTTAQMIQHVFIYIDHACTQECIHARARAEKEYDRIETSTSCEPSLAKGVTDRAKGMWLAFNISLVHGTLYIVDRRKRGLA